MSTEFAKASLRLAAAAVLAGGLAACSTMQSIDPTGLLGDDSNSSAADTGGLSDAGAAAADDTAQPDVASVPDRPEAPSSPDENAQVANSLQADAANVQYSAESLRGGTEAAAAPPPAAASTPAPGATDTSTPASTQVAEAAPAQPQAAPPPADTASAEVASADVPADNITPGTTNTGPLTEAPAQPAPAPPPSDAAPTDVAALPDEATPAAPDETPPQTASAEAPTTEAPAQPAAALPPDASAPAETAAASEAVPEPSSDAATASAPAQPEPAAAPVPSTPTQVASAAPVPGAQAPVTRRAAPGFAPSNAPPLDPSVSQFVSAPVVARYKQTAMLKPSVYPDYTSTPAYFGPATATVVFPGDTTILDEKGLQQVRAAAELFKAHGARGYVRIVGYASASSGNLSDARLMHVNFDHSQARATAIARALMKEGVPASKVLVDSAPQTASVAKAEIFVQG
jgi:outer membrane protein OmpA-like peptidoglycan-associated protein